MSISLGKLLSPCTCNLILIILFIMYAGPMVFDIFPSSDSYLGGFGFLGIWGVVFSVVVGMGISMYYGMNCVSEKTVYRCAGFGCDLEKKGLFFPDKFPDDLKQYYIKKVSYDNEGKPIYDGLFSHFPLSKFNRTLKQLNNEFLYREGDKLMVKNLSS